PRRRREGSGRGRAPHRRRDRDRRAVAGRRAHGGDLVGRLRAGAARDAAVRLVPGPRGGSDRAGPDDPPGRHGPASPRAAARAGAGRVSELSTADLTLAVVVPATDGPVTLDRCLAAIRAAQDPPDEVVVVSRPAGSGPAAARNTGARAAGADVVMFVDSD